MRASSFRYLLKEGLRNMWRNRVMSLTSIGVLTTCLLIVGAAFLLTVNVNSMVKYVEGQSEMCVYMKEGLTEEDLTQAEEAIRAVPNVKEVTFISKEEGLENTKESFGDEGYLLEGYEGEDNPIPDSFVVKVNEIDQTRDTQKALQEIAGVDVVNASGEVADTLSYVQNTVVTLGTVVIIALAVISLVIISNTIRATIFTRRKEINIMKFVGATNWFIRWPFIIEGLIIGAIAATLSYFGSWYIYTYFVDNVFAGINIVKLLDFESIKGLLILIFYGTGLFIGIAGSSLAIRKYLRV